MIGMMPLDISRRSASTARLRPGDLAPQDSEVEKSSGRHFSSISCSVFTRISYQFFSMVAPVFIHVLLSFLHEVKSANFALTGVSIWGPLPAMKIGKHLDQATKGTLLVTNGWPNYWDGGFPLSSHDYNPSVTLRNNFSCSRVSSAIRSAFLSTFLSMGSSISVTGACTFRGRVEPMRFALLIA
jgi:hypothetical protein